MLRKLSHTLLTISLLAVPALTASAQSPTAFDVTVRNFVYIGKTGYNANVAGVTLHKTTNPTVSGGGFDSTGTPIVFTNDTAQSLNAAGISSKDGYMYGLEYFYAGPTSVFGKMYRIGANAVAQRIGIVPAPTALDAGRPILTGAVNLTSATIDSNGDYWFNASTVTDMDTPFSGSKMDLFLGKISGISLLGTANAADTLVPTYYKLGFSDTILQRGYANLMNQQVAMIAYSLPASNADGGWQDMDIDPVTGNFYMYIGFPSAPTPIGTTASPINPYPKPPINSHLVYVDRTTTPMEVVVVNATPVTTPNRESDGAWFAQDSSFYVGFTDGQYAQVNLSTGALSGLTQSAIPLDTTNNMRGDFATNIAGPALPPTDLLPVKLTRFSADKTSDGVALSWSTEAESGLRHFELQKSLDGVQFTTIATVKPAGNGSSYAHKDGVSASTVYYRLAMTFTDGTTERSATLKVQAADGAMAISVYPTIVRNGTLHLSLAARSAEMRIYSLSGATVQAVHLDGAGPVNHFAVPVSLPAGTYFVQVSDNTSGRIIGRSPIIIP